jgi:hypothetical protein
MAGENPGRYVKPPGLSIFCCMSSHKANSYTGISFCSSLKNIMHTGIRGEKLQK